MEKHELTAARARELFHYDPSTGSLTWKVDKGRARAGQPAGNTRADGYLQVRVDGRKYFGHRLAWLIHTGRWPEHHVDHVNGSTNHNAFANLRDVPKAVNMQNRRRARIDNPLGVQGVHWNGRRFIARITISRKTTYIGSFTSAESAHAAFVEAKRRHHAGCTI